MQWTNVALALYCLGSPAQSLHLLDAHLLLLHSAQGLVVPADEFGVTKLATGLSMAVQCLRDLMIYEQRAAPVRSQGRFAVARDLSR